MKTEKQSIVPKSFIVMMMVMLGIALLPIRYYGYYVLLMVMGGNILFGLGVDWLFSTIQSSDFH